MSESEFDDEEFHREHYRNAVEKAKAGDVESAWYLISTYVDWIEGSSNPSPVAAFLGEFLGTLLEIRSDRQPASPTRDQLATALRALHIVPRRGRPSSKGTDANAKRLAAEELLRRPQDDGGHGMGAEEAREWLERDGLGALRQRDVRTEDSPTATAITLLSTPELDHLANDGEITDDVYRHASSQPGPDCGDRARGQPKESQGRRRK